MNLQGTATIRAPLCVARSTDSTASCGTKRIRRALFDQVTRINVERDKFDYFFTRHHRLRSTNKKTLNNKSMEDSVAEILVVIRALVVWRIFQAMKTLLIKEPPPPHKKTQITSTNSRGVCVTGVRDDHRQQLQARRESTPLHDLTGANMKSGKLCSSRSERRCGFDIVRRSTSDDALRSPDFCGVP